MRSRDEPEEDVEAVDITRVEADWMAGLGGGISVLQEIVEHLWGTSHFTCTRQTKDHATVHQAVVLEDEGGELEDTNKAICVRMCHI